MTSWFTNGWLRLGSKKRAQKEDNDNEEEYPTMKKAKKTEDTTLAGASLAETGSWLLCQDREGRMYWWNDVTGQWTYQLYSQQGQGYPHQQQQLLQQNHHHQQQHLLMSAYSQQQHHYNPTNHHHHHYNPNSAPAMYMQQRQQLQQQQPWGLPSPSSRMPAAAALGSFGFGWGSGRSAFGSFDDAGNDDDDDDDDDDDEDEEEEEVEWTSGKKAGAAAWDKFFDGRGRAVWIHSATGTRSSIDPAGAGTKTL
ncbi:unnamed protein product [Scytosiphon promiscuus]